MAYAVIAKWTARSGEEERVRHALVQLMEPTRAEPGCRFYLPTVDDENPRAFTLLEVYDDKKAYEAHTASAHFQRFAVEEGIPLLESRERVFLLGLE